jgi:hypothetical protein
MRLFPKKSCEAGSFNFNSNALIFSDLTDFSQLPSTAVTEVLMLEMKMAASAKVYLVSGFPRSMRDMAEYSDKVVVNYFRAFFCLQTK